MRGGGAVEGSHGAGVPSVENTDDACDDAGDDAWLGKEGSCRGTYVGARVQNLIKAPQQLKATRGSCACGNKLRET